MAARKREGSKAVHREPSTNSASKTKTLSLGAKPGPKSFVIKSESVKSVNAQELVLNIRKVLEPNTATKLKERKRNKLKDYVSIAGELGITHLLIFSQSLFHLSLRISHFPRGPSLYFNVLEYSLIKDISHGQINPISPGYEHKFPPLLVLDGFFESPSKELQLAATFLQNIFPSVSVSKSKYFKIRRIVLFHYDADSGNIYMRHYYIQLKEKETQNSSLNTILSFKKKASSTKKLFEDLNQFSDIADYVVQNASGYESETEAPELLLPGKGSRKTTKKAVSLIEIGPRLTLELTKVQQGFFQGEFLYSKYGLSKDSTPQSDHDSS